MQGEEEVEEVEEVVEGVYLPGVSPATGHAWLDPGAAVLVLYGEVAGDGEEGGGGRVAGLVGVVVVVVPEIQAPTSGCTLLGCGAGESMNVPSPAGS